MKKMKSTEEIKASAAKVLWPALINEVRWAYGPLDKQDVRDICEIYSLPLILQGLEENWAELAVELIVEGSPGTLEASLELIEQFCKASLDGRIDCIESALEAGIPGAILGEYTGDQTDASADELMLIIHGSNLPREILDRWMDDAEDLLEEQREELLYEEKELKRSMETLERVKDAGWASMDNERRASCAGRQRLLVSRLEAIVATSETIAI